MSPFTRKLLVPAEGLVYGPAYAFLQHLIRSPQPLPPEATWQTILEKKSAAIQFVSSHYPIRPLRWPLLYAKLKQDHFTGIAAHYDVSNDFYELFLDKKYMFYSCADFPAGNETLDEAQQIKADFILNLIDPQPGQHCGICSIPSTAAIL